MNRDGFYANMADQIIGREMRGDWGAYGGDAAVASLRCFRRYHKDARFEFVDRAGVVRWMAPGMMRIEAIALRVGITGSGYITTAAIAAEALVSRGYVSKVLTKLEAWGVVGVIRTRGRNGKLFIFARVIGDRLDAYMAEAKRRLHDSKVGRMARRLRSALNVSSLFSTRKGGGNVTGSDPSDDAGDGYGVGTPYVTYTEETFSGFAREVLHERARLALFDPEGEAEAVQPLSPEQAGTLWNATHAILRKPGSPDSSVAEALGLPILGKVHGVIHCPAHEDRGASLSWRATTDRVLLHCFAGCTYAEIRRAVLG